MRSTRVRAAAAVVTCLAGGAMAIGPAAAATAAHHHGHKAKSTHGFFVVDRNANTQKVESYGTDSALVRDVDGHEHVITTQPSKADPNQGHLVYINRDTDSSKWVAHQVPGLIPLNGGVQVEAHLSYNGQRIFIVSYQCDGVYVSDASVSAHRMPLPTQVTSLDECADPPTHSNNPPIAESGTLYGRTISILLPGTLPDTYAVYSAEPGGVFTPGTVLPTANDFTPVQVAIDPQYGRLVVVGTGSDGTNQQIYETYQDRYSDTWSTPIAIASLNSATTDYKIDSVATYARHTYIGLEKPKNGKHLAHSLYLVKGTPTGQWLGTIALPHSGGTDINLRLVVNTDRNHLHAVWTRITASHKGKAGGLMHEAQASKGWGKPTFLTHNQHDVATQITLTNNYRPIVGYNQ